MKLVATLLLFLPIILTSAFIVAPASRVSSSTKLNAVNNDRRHFLASTTGAAVAGVAAAAAAFKPASPASASDGGVDYKAVAADVADLIKKNPDQGPTMLRLAWHSSGTYDKMLKDGGSSGGTIRFKEELAHGGNAGLAVTAVPWLEPVYNKYQSSGLSYADLYTLAGVVAIKEAGGPTIGWSSGRVDAVDASAVTPDGRLPNADSGPPGADKSDAQHLRDIFYRMGFNDQEIVILSGAHALGRCHPTASGFDGPWTYTPLLFNNAYYQLLTALTWEQRQWDGPYQYVNTGKGGLMMLPTDLVLLQDKKFKKWVDVYAKDNALFLKDFSKAFQTLEELGTSGLTATEWA